MSLTYSTKFEVMLKTGEHSWEEQCGPYDTFEEAENARIKWFRPEEIPYMAVLCICRKLPTEIKAEE
jgi:hypothetical protein